MVRRPLTIFSDVLILLDFVFVSSTLFDFPIIKIKSLKIAILIPQLSNGWRIWHADHLKNHFMRQYICEFLQFWLLVITARWGILYAEKHFCASSFSF